jgi:1-acyl-sn-glycerol-3-phosphate acyltransferase
MKAPETRPRERVLEVVRQLASELSPGRDLGELGLGWHLELDLGIGSLERLELVTRLEAALGRRLRPEDVFAARTVGELVELASASPAPAWQVAVAAPSGQAPEPPEQAGDLVEVLRYQALRQPGRQVLYFLSEGKLERAYTYPELVAEARSLAAGMAQAGVGRGHRVALMLPTGMDFVAAFFAALWLGAVPVPLYPPWRADQAEEFVARQSAILENARLSLLVTSSRAWTATRILRLHAPSVRAAALPEELRRPGGPEPVTLSPEDVALIQYTSGSTGSPRGVVLTHAALLANIRAFGKGLEIGPREVFVSWLPLYHDMGLIGALLGGIYFGVPTVLMGPQDFLARPSRWLWAIHSYRASMTVAPNFAYQICLRKIPDEELVGLDLSCLRVAANGAEMVRPETLEGFARRFAPYGLREEALLPCYGLAEAALAVALPPVGRKPRVDRVQRERLEKESLAWPARPGEDALAFVSCGRALPGMEIRVVDERGRRLEERQVGRLEFRGPSALREYFRNPEATAAIRRPGGWIDTGDLAYLAEGELYLTGRIKDMIVVAGRNLYPQDVEETVGRVEGVRPGCVAAFSVPDPESAGEALVVVAETRQTGPSERARLEQAIRRQVTAALGLPPLAVVVAGPGTVPKTPSGKIRRSECRRRYLAGELVRRPAPWARWLRLLAPLPARLWAEVRRRPGEYLHAARCMLCLATFWSFLMGVALLSPGLGRRLSRSASRAALAAAGLRLEVTGPAPPAGPCAVVANHASVLDPLVLLAAWPGTLRFVAAPWVLAHPLLRPLMLRLGHLQVRRGDPSRVRSEIERVRAVLEGETLAAFPEGGLDLVEGLRPFALGIFQAAAEAGVPVVPVALAGTRASLPWPRLVPRPGRLRVVFGEALRARDSSWGEVVELARRARAFIAEHCGEPLREARLQRAD